MVNRVGSYIMTKLKISIEFFKLKVQSLFWALDQIDSGRLTEVHGLVSKIEAYIL